VRGFSLDEGKPPPPTEASPLWRLDITAWQQGEPSEPRSFCVMSGQAPVLARESTGSEGRLMVYRDANHVSRSVTWPTGARDVSWPSDMPVTDGELYSLNLDSQGATTVRWRTVSANSGSLTALASQLLDNGCYDQLDTLQTQVASK
jgi:hypothetical protein